MPKRKNAFGYSLRSAVGGRARFGARQKRGPYNTKGHTGDYKPHQHTFPIGSNTCSICGTPKI